MAQLFANNAASKLAAAITIGATSLTLTTGEGAKFPAITGSDNFLVTLVGGTASSETSWEIVSVTARAGDVLTIVRAQEGTTAAAWAIATPVELRATAGTLAGKQDALVSGTNIKTLNGQSLLGIGNVLVRPLQYALVSTAAGSIPAATGYCTADITAPAGSFILLPDATTLTAGFAYELRITNSVYLVPFASAGPFGNVFNVGVYRLFLLDNTTPTGVWAYTAVVVSTGATSGNIASAIVTIASANGAYASQPASIALDTDRTLLIYYTQGAPSGSSGVWAVVLSCPDVSASKAPVIAIGTPVLISGTNTGVSSSSATMMQCISVGTDLCAVAWNSAASAANDSAPVVVMVATSGVSVTAGAVSALHASETNSGVGSNSIPMQICSPATNKFVVAYSSAVDSAVYARACTTAGTTITLGAETTVASGLGYTAGYIRNIGIVAHTSNTVVIGYNDETAAFGKLIAATFSGTTLTFGTAVNSGQTAGGYYLKELVYLSATSGWCTNVNFGTVYTLSGTAITVGTQFTGLNGCKTIAISATKVFQIFSGTGASKQFLVSGTTISNGSPATLSTNTSADMKAAYVINGNALYVVFNNSTTIINISTFTLRSALSLNAITGGGKYGLYATSSPSNPVTAQATQYPTTTPLN